MTVYEGAVSFFLVRTWNVNPRIIEGLNIDHVVVYNIYVNILFL